MCPQLDVNRTAGMDGFVPSIPEQPVLMLGAVGTREFVEPLVSHCCATHFRLLVQTKVSKGKDTRVARRREARRSTAMLVPKGCGQNSDRFGDPQTGWPHRRSAPDTLRRCASRRFTRAPNTGGLARRPELLQLQTELSLVAALCRITPWLIRRTKLVTLSERQRRLPVLGPLGVAPSSGGRTRTKRAGCLSEASFRHARVRPEPRRESARSADARQGALLLVTSLGQAREVTRKAVRNPKPEFARVVDSDAPLERRGFPYPSLH
jgi:hypothetical protein